jgi:hypothetical protein
MIMNRGFRPSLPGNRVHTWVGILLLLFASPDVSAQSDLSGVWSSKVSPEWFTEDHKERLAGPEIGDYLGLPINEAARRWALSWDPSRLSMQEHQCQAHTSAYIFNSPVSVRISEDRDVESHALVGIKIFSQMFEQSRTIWMDGRARPSKYAEHSWQGFSLGRWDGNVLTVKTTHLKQGWHRRNGVPSSDRTTFTEHLIRYGNYLTWVGIIDDPVFLSEPMVKSRDFVLSRTGEISFSHHCENIVEVVDRSKYAVPHFLPGKNPYLMEHATRYGIPWEATMGGSETVYPEFAKKLDTGKKGTGK